MESWYDNLEPDALVIVNDSGYTNDAVRMQYIHHFIQHSAAYSICNETRLLIVDGHDSHKTEQFITIAEEYNVILYALPPHTTHLLQPLDIKVFQQCKHFHQKALDKAVRSFDYEYKLRTFLADLPYIRNQSLTIKTIQSGWREAGLWPYNPALVIDKLKDTRNETPEYEDPIAYDITMTPKTSRQTVEGVEHWQRKAEQLFSSPSRHGFEAFARGTTIVLHRAELYKTELDIVALRAFQQRDAKARARKSLQSGGQLYAHEARAKREEKEAQARQRQMRKMRES